MWSHEWQEKCRKLIFPMPCLTHSTMLFKHTLAHSDHSLQPENKLKQQLFTYSDQEGCFLCSWQKLRPLKTQVSSRLARPICEKWPSPNSASRSITPESPQHLFQVRSCPSPSLLLGDSCALPAALPCLEKAAPSPQHLLIESYGSQTSKRAARAQVLLKRPQHKAET